MSSIWESHMKMIEIEADPDGAGLTVGVAAASFNEVITAGLLRGALDGLEEAGVEEVRIVHLPGALEIPLAAQRLIESGCHAVVAVGAVIEGETDHYEHVSTQASAGIRQVGLATGVPVANAVLTVREFEHARDRSLPGAANKGYEAARAAIAMVNAVKAIDRLR
jgi:6,7-dimethyl-8-ribityllumazine synthase